MSLRWDEDRLAAHMRNFGQAHGISETPQLSELPQPKRGNKFGAKKTRSGERTFASKKEAQRYHELLLRLKAGEIRRLECQPVFVMHTENERGEWIACGKFTPDFRYQEDMKDINAPDIEWRTVVEDVKGGKATRTEAYMLRKRHVEAEYGIQIVEV